MHKHINSKLYSIDSYSIPVELHLSGQLSRHRPASLSPFDGLLIRAKDTLRLNICLARRKRARLSSSTGKRLSEIETLCMLCCQPAIRWLFSSRPGKIKFMLKAMSKKLWDWYVLRKTFEFSESSRKAS